MTAAIQFGSKQINFMVVYSNRKTLGITVTPDLDVLVNAPVDSSLDKIKEKILKKAPWIIKQQSFFVTFHPKTPKRKYIAGETHLYLGRQYLLKIKNEVKELVESWYLDKGKVKINKIAKPLFDKFVIKHNLSLIIYHLKKCQLDGAVVRQKEK